MKGDIIVQLEVSGTCHVFFVFLLTTGWSRREWGGEERGGGAGSWEGEGLSVTCSPVKAKALPVLGTTGTWMYFGLSYPTLRSTP